MKQLAQMIFELGKQKGFDIPGEILEFDHLPIHADDVRLRIPAIDKARTVLGWEPKVSLEDALEICLERIATRT
jgi:nucleoside-diphosphate-sugar epimerase